MTDMNFDNLKRFMDRLTSEKVPGNAAEIYYRGEKVFSYASGYSDLENKISMTGKEHLFIYSCSKVATVTAALQLIERGEIQSNIIMQAKIAVDLAQVILFFVQITVLV